MKNIVKSLAEVKRDLELAYARKDKLADFRIETENKLEQEKDAFIKGQLQKIINQVIDLENHLENEIQDTEQAIENYVEDQKQERRDLIRGVFV